MKKQLQLTTLALFTAVFTVYGQNTKSHIGTPTPKPNIILVMADDLGWGDVGFNGNPFIQTPELDKMAANGIQFERFYAAAPVCSPTRGSVITGRNPERYGIFFANVGHMKKEEFTIAEALKTQGYTTGHFGKWHLGGMTNSVRDGRRGGRDSADYSPPWENGFDVCFSTEQAVPTWDPMENQPFPTKYWTGPGIFATKDLKGDDSKIMMDRVIPFIDHAVKDKQPFLAVVWFHTPHSPVIAGPPYLQMYKQYDENKQHYYGCITAMDEQVGRLRRELRRLKIAGNTVLFFTSDNGPAGEGGGVKQVPGGRQQGSPGLFRGRKGSLYEGGIREPGLMEWPDKIKSSRKIYAAVTTCDYFPTILNIVGFKDKEGPRPLDGINIMPILNGTENERPVSIAFKSMKQRSIMDNQFKLYSADNGKTFELYDLLNDPYETHNIAGTYPDKVSTMATMLGKWIESCKQSNNGADYH